MIISFSDFYGFKRFSISTFIVVFSFTVVACHFDLDVTDIFCTSTILVFHQLVIALHWQWILYAKKVVWHECILNLYWMASVDSSFLWNVFLHFLAPFSVWLLSCYWWLYFFLRWINKGFCYISAMGQHFQIYFGLRLWSSIFWSLVWLISAHLVVILCHQMLGFFKFYIPLACYKFSP